MHLLLRFSFFSNHLSILSSTYTFRQDSIACFWECFGAWQNSVREKVFLKLPSDLEALKGIDNWRFEENAIISMARLKDEKGQVSGETFLNFLQRWKPVFEHTESEHFYSVTLLDALCINLLIGFQAPLKLASTAL